jgi:cytochrome o ubiquinol oxidase subunit IV
MSKQLMYIIGFLVSLVLTLAAYFLTQYHLDNQHAKPPHELMYYVLAFLAFSQLLVQLIFFLHIGEETKPRWKLTTLFFASLVVLIVVWGSIWIMSNLEYFHGHGREGSNVEEYIKEKELIDHKDGQH